MKQIVCQNLNNLNFYTIMKKKTVQEEYKKLSQHEHILARPDSYVGSIEMEKSHKWVLPPDAKRFEYRQVYYAPALYKIFDEVLVNAADNYQRDRKMNLLKVQINQEQGYISVHNNGKGIPVVIHKEHKIYVPELIFGHLLTGSNYDDEQKKVVGGRNGFGAKLANIFSNKFTLECGDHETGRKFFKEWHGNMFRSKQAQIKEYKGKDFVNVTFYPDFKKFKMEKMDNDIFSLFCKRVYDMAGLMPKVKVVLNEKEIEIKSFLMYVDMYFTTNNSSLRIRDAQVDNKRWQIVVSASEGQFRHVSFVNSICTSRGGKHVDYITEQIVEGVQEKIKKKDKDLTLKPFQIKAHLWVFINCLIENPAFDSQTKQTLTLKSSQFGSTCILSDKMIKQIQKSDIIDSIYNEAKAKELSKLARATAGGKKQRVKGIQKLEDANDAGTKNSEKCTLILTEGDSAKALAMAGIQIVGRDHYGVFPLKGKLLNVRQASNNSIMKNEQIQSLIKILGLQLTKQYNDVKNLRYGSIMIMSDQDTDGSHIKGLVLNFIHHLWPSLFHMSGFMKQFITPLLKAFKGQAVESFFTLQDYKNWSETVNIKQWKIKYYKGLGTSTDKQAQEYFDRLNRHKLDFQYVDQEDDSAMDLVFNKKKAQQRKDWLAHYDPTDIMVYGREPVRYKDFVNKQLIHYSNEDNIRNIASIIDGFKPGQRKILYACFKRNLKKQIKVAQLAGYVAEHSAYHHGENSLTQTIVKMAQNFVGSNNINLLMPNGQFGSRNEGGEDHASARYIFTCLNKVTRYIFKEEDDHTLTYVQDDGQMVEPEYYVPVIPMFLVNGCKGLGTGWSTSSPKYDPRQLAKMLLNKLDGFDFEQINPSYKGFIGEFVPKPDGTGVDVKGVVDVDSENNLVHIRELSIGRWTKKQKAHIDEIMEKDDWILGMKQYHTKNTVHFQLEISEQKIQNRPDPQYYEKVFKVNGSLPLTNIVGFNSQRKLFRYPTMKELLGEYYLTRLKHYEKRKEYLLSKIQRDVEILTMKEKFILEVIDETIKIRNQKKKKICQVLQEKGYVKFSNLIKIKSTKAPAKQTAGEGRESSQSESEGQNNKKDIGRQYNYLLSMNLWSLTYEKVENIKKHRKDKEEELAALEKIPIQEMWKTDIEQFLIVLEEVQQQQKEQLQKANKKLKFKDKQKKGRRAVAKGKKQRVKKQTKEQHTEEKKSKKEKQKKEKKSGGSKKSNQSVKQSTNSEASSQEDFMSKIKSRYLKENSQTESKESSKEQGIKKAGSYQSGIVTRPKRSKRNLKNLSEDDDDFEVVRVLKPSSRKKKRTVDSDEEFSMDEKEEED